MAARDLFDPDERAADDEEKENRAPASPQRQADKRSESRQQCDGTDKRGTSG